MTIQQLEYDQVSSERVPLTTYELNKRGQDGWELVSVMETMTHNPQALPGDQVPYRLFLYIFKRPITAS